MDMARLIESLFRSFCDQVLRPVYHFGDEQFYGQLDMTLVENYGCNPFVVTEDDYKLKLGGYLESHLLPLGLTVHAEMNEIYPTRERTDLSIHDCSMPNGIYGNQNSMRSTVRAIIELKGANVGDPGYSFRKKDKNSVKADIRKLSQELRSPIAECVRCLILLDEYPRPPNGFIPFDEEDMARIKEHRIRVLSNNRYFEPEA